jgi:hypothetical protein
MRRIWNIKVYTVSSTTMYDLLMRIGYNATDE